MTMHHECTVHCTCMSTRNADLTRPDLTRPDPFFYSPLRVKSFPYCLNYRGRPLPCGKAQWKKDRAAVTAARTHPHHTNQTEEAPDARA